MRGEDCVEAAIVPQQLAELVAAKVRAQLESENVSYTKLNVTNQKERIC